MYNLSKLHIFIFFIGLSSSNRSQDYSSSDTENLFSTSKKTLKSSESSGKTKSRFKGNKIHDLQTQNYDKNEQNYEAFIRELIFREFYYVLMTNYPETAHVAFKEKYQQLKWSYNEENFKLWKDGNTGFPIIDAAMEELKTTGFMHNRMRMVVSQFLTKDLFIDWIWGESFFKQKLIDYDAASNVHGWQWSASTGTDAVPYFRMFNPIRQSERFDNNARYIKTYIPKLNQIDAKYLHDTHKFEQQIKGQGVEIGKDYPKQMIDHKESRQRVMSEFKALD